MEDHKDEIFLEMQSMDFKPSLSSSDALTLQVILTTHFEKLQLVMSDEGRRSLTSLTEYEENSMESSRMREG